MDRLERFEKMLADIIHQAEYEQAEMVKLKIAGKEKTATYRQYLGNRMLYKLMLAKYKQYSLLDRQSKFVEIRLWISLKQRITTDH